MCPSRTPVTPASHWCVSQASGTGSKATRHRNFPSATVLAGAGLLLAAFVSIGAQCDPSLDASRYSPLPFYFNQTDKTNGGASFIASAACSACHSNIAAFQANHPHAHALKRAAGAAPAYPSNASPDGVPNPPVGLDWTDVAYVIGGFSKGALFVDQTGFLVTNASSGTDVQWNQSLAPSDVMAGFAPFAPGGGEPLPLAFERFRKLTVGARQRDADNPLSQDGRAGIEGTWHETGVQCEACHGPGSNHAPNPRRRQMFVDPTGSKSCNECHAAQFDPTAKTIAARDGFILPLQQATELAASGGHASFRCTYCHDPHVAISEDRTRAIRNTCTACHTDANMALHRGRVFRRGDYEEPLTCESCHMPFATRAYSMADAAVVGDAARMGDTRTHIFRIRKGMEDFTSFFNATGDAVVLDNQNRAAVTVDFVCLRCHNGNGAFPLSVQSAGDIAPHIHLDLGNQ